MADPGKVRVRLPDGRMGTIPRSSLESARRAGAELVEEAGPAVMQAGAAGSGEAGGFSKAVDATGRVLRAAGETMDITPVLAAIGSANPVKEFGKLGGHMLDAQAGQLHKAREAWRGGNFGDALRYGMGYLLPILGPGVNDAGDALQRGEYAEGAGKTLGLGLQVAAPMAMQAKGSVQVPGLLKSQLNPAEAAAIAFADAQGIPVDLAMRTGNRFVVNTKTALKNTVPGAATARRAEGAQAAALAEQGGRLADATYPAPVAPEQAGAGVRGALEAEVLGHNTEAARNYDQLRQFEADPAHTREVPIRTARTPEGQADLDAFSMSLAGRPFGKLQPHEQSAILRTAAAAGVDVAERAITEAVPLPVDLRGVKAELAPTAAQLQRQMPIAQQRASAGMKAIENIMGSPDFLPASVADTDLSAIKAAARGADMPELRTFSQGLAANAVTKLEDAVAAGVAEAGPEATAARDAGRAATVRKYQTAAVLRELRQEPVQAFEQLTFAGDSAVEFLKRVQGEIPNELPKVGRAYLQGLLEEAAKSGEFQLGRSVWNRWQKLGPETKRVLFRNGAMISDLDNFFRLAEMQSRNPNPSGTAHVLSMTGHAGASMGLMVTNPVKGAAVLIAPWVLAKMLYSPKAARILMNGMKVPLKDKAAASAAFHGIMAQVSQFSKGDGEDDDKGSAGADRRQ